ncbi:MAG: hypothetical protein HOP26_03335 [Methylotenera sp.]|nr:hypothetical protein [Methylotenera sp.]NOU41456.1 hypothetical protein [Methylotenera sp.]
MAKFWLFCALSLLSLSACEQQKQASAEVGAVPKQILDKVTSDINAASAIAEERLKAVESLDSPAAKNEQK